MICLAIGILICCEEQRLKWVRWRTDTLECVGRETYLRLFNRRICIQEWSSKGCSLLLWSKGVSMFLWNPQEKVLKLALSNSLHSSPFIALHVGTTFGLRRIQTSFFFFWATTASMFVYSFQIYLSYEWGITLSAYIAILSWMDAMICCKNCNNAAGL